MALIDRVIHHAEIVSIQGSSYRHKEAQERTASKQTRGKKFGVKSLAIDESAHPHRIDEHWTPEHAAAVYECLSELTETILAYYGAAIHEF